MRLIESCCSAGDLPRSGSEIKPFARPIDAERCLRIRIFFQSVQNRRQVLQNRPEVRFDIYAIKEIVTYGDGFLEGSYVVAPIGGDDQHLPLLHVALVRGVAPKKGKLFEI